MPTAWYNRPPVYVEIFSPFGQPDFTEQKMQSAQIVQLYMCVNNEPARVPDPHPNKCKLSMNALLEK